MSETVFPVERRRKNSPSNHNNAFRLTVPAFSTTVVDTIPGDVEMNRKISRKLRSQSTTDLSNLAHESFPQSTDRQSSKLLQELPVTFSTDHEDCSSPTQNSESARTNSASTSVDTSDSDADDYIERTPLPKCESFHGGKLLVDTTVQCSVEQLFTLLFTGSKFFLDFHSIRGTTNMVQSSWAEETSGQQVRTINCTIKLTNKIGPSTSGLTEKQALLPHSRRKLLYAIEMETINSGIPYADSFYVSGHFCLSRLSKNTSKLMIFGQVKYKKSVNSFMKGFIEKQTYAGLSEFYNSLAEAVKEEASKNQEFISSTNISKSKEGTPVRQDTITESKGQLPVKRFKRPAPLPPVNVKQTTSKRKFSSTILDLFSSWSVDSAFINKFILILLIGLSLLHVYMLVKVIELETLATNISTDCYCRANSPSEEWLNLLLEKSNQHKHDLKVWYELLGPTVKYLQGLDIIKD